MLIFGHRFIDSENFYHISDIDAIEKTPPSSTLLIEFSEKNLDIIKYSSSQNIPFALVVTDINEIIYASALGAAFIIVDNDLAKTAQELAQNYLFDAKILVHITTQDQIEELALLGIDGVVFSDAIVKVL